MKVIQVDKQTPRHRARYGEEQGLSMMEEATEIETEQDREIQGDRGMGDT